MGHWKKKYKGDVTILSHVGDKIFGLSGDYLREYVQTLVKKGKVHIIVNFQGVKFISSMVLGAVVYSHNIVYANNKGHFCVVYSEGFVAKLFKITKLNTVIKCFYSTEEAIASFKK